MAPHVAIWIESPLLQSTGNTAHAQAFFRERCPFKNPQPDNSWPTARRVDTVRVLHFFVPTFARTNYANSTCNNALTGGSGSNSTSSGGDNTRRTGDQSLPPR